MKKILAALVVLALASSAMAAVTITVNYVGDVGPYKQFEILYNDTEPNLVRAFALDVRLDNDVNIIEVNDVNECYNIHPGSFGVDYGTDPNGVPTGTPVADDSNYPALPGPPDGNGMTIEMGSLYEGGPASPNAPPTSGVLLTFLTDGDCCVTVSENSIRGGIVMEDPCAPSNADFSGAEGVCSAACGTCRGDWDGDNSVEMVDDLFQILGKISMARFLIGNPWFTKADTVTYPGLAPWNPCADWDGDGTVELVDDLFQQLGKISQARFFYGNPWYTCGDATIDP